MTLPHRASRWRVLSAVVCIWCQAWGHAHSLTRVSGVARSGLLVATLLVGAVALAPAQQTEPDERVEALERQIELQPAEAQPYLMLAAIHHEAGRRRVAERVLQRGIERADGPEPLHWALVQLMVEEERWADAVTALGPLAPDSTALATRARMRFNVGLDLYRKGESDRARSAFRHALEDDPALSEAAVMLGQLLVEAGELDAARGVADAALEHSPGDGRLLSVRSATLEGEEGAEAALDAARALRREDPENDAIGLELARLLLRAGDLEGVVELYDTLLAGPQPAEETFETIAGFWLRAGEADTAVAILTTGVDHYPGSGALWEGLGDAEWEREEWKDAALAYRTAAVRLEEPERAEMGIADAHTMSGDTAAALDALRSMHERPAPRAVRLEVAERAVTLGDHALADVVYDDLLESDPDDPFALAGAARLAESQGDSARALALYRRDAELLDGGPAGPLGVLRLDPPETDSARSLMRLALWRAVDRVEASEELALSRAQMGNGRAGHGATSPVRSGASALSRLDPEDPVERARETLTELLDTIVFETEWGEDELEQLRRAYPNSVHFRLYAADLAAHNGRYEEALVIYDRLLALRATDTELQTARARTLEELGRTEEARSAYARALELDPEDEDVFRALGRIHQDEETLPMLLEQVRRLQTMNPDLEVLVEREIELLHRLGRLEEARKVAEKYQEKEP